MATDEELYQQYLKEKQDKELYQQYLAEKAQNDPASQQYQEGLADKFGEFGSNTLKKGWETVKGLGSMAIHPVDTAQALYQGAGNWVDKFGQADFAGKADMIGNAASSVVPGGNTLYHVAKQQTGLEPEESGDQILHRAADDVGSFLGPYVAAEGIGTVARGVKSLADMRNDPLRKARDLGATPQTLRPGNLRTADDNIAALNASYPGFEQAVKGEPSLRKVYDNIVSMKDTVGEKISKIYETVKQGVPNADLVNDPIIKGYVSKFLSPQGVSDTTRATIKSALDDYFSIFQPGLKIEDFANPAGPNIFGSIQPTMLWEARQTLDDLAKFGTDRPGEVAEIYRDLRTAAKNQLENTIAKNGPPGVVDALKQFNDHYGRLHDLTDQVNVAVGKYAAQKAAHVPMISGGLAGYELGQAIGHPMLGAAVGAAAGPELKNFITRQPGAAMAYNMSNKAQSLANGMSVAAPIAGAVGSEIQNGFNISDTPINSGQQTISDNSGTGNVSVSMGSMGGAAASVAPSQSDQAFNHIINLVNQGVTTTQAPPLLSRDWDAVKKDSQQWTTFSQASRAMFGIDPNNIPEIAQRNLFQQLAQANPRVLAPSANGYTTEMVVNGRTQVFGIDRDLALQKAMQIKNPAQRAMQAGGLLEDGTLLPEPQNTSQPAPPPRKPVDPGMKFMNYLSSQATSDEKHDNPGELYTQKTQLTDSETMLQQMEKARMYH